MKIRVSFAGVHLSMVSVVLLFTAIASFAQVPQPEVIKQINVENIGAGRLDKSFVEVHLGSKVGEPLNSLLVAKEVRDLVDTGHFSEVRVEAEKVDGGVALVYLVRKKLRLSAPVVIKGAKKYSKSKIEKIIQIEEGDLVDEQTLGVAAVKLMDDYRSSYYPDVEVTSELEIIDQDAGRAKAMIKIKEGRRAKVRKMTFQGMKEIQAAELGRAMKQRSWWDPRSFFRKKRYSETELEGARRMLRDYYRQQGFLDVTVDPPSVEQVDKGKLDIEFKIVEGPQYIFGKTAINGINLFPETELYRLLARREGEFASSDIIKNNQNRLQDYYGSRGYLNTAVRTAVKPRPDENVVDITFDINEGRLTTIRNVEILGNIHTRDKVIRRELLVAPGEIYNEVKIRRSERIVSNLGFFGNVRSFPLNTDVDDMKDLVVEVEEQRSGHFMMGAGFSSLDKLMGFVELSQSNFDILGWPYFRGAGQKLRLSAQVSDRRQDYKLSFEEPWFMDRKLSLGFDLYSSDVDYDDYNIGRTGGALSIGRKLWGANRIRAQYRLERVDYSNIEDTNEYTVVESGDAFYFDQDEVVKSSMRLTFLHNSCDHPLMPTRGTRASMTGRLMGGPLGFDTDLYNMSLQAKHYIPLWFNHVLSIKGKYEVVEEFDGTDDVPLADRLFLGGGRTLRGFKYREVGPKAIRSIVGDTGVETEKHRPIGGKSLALLSAEYIIPIAGPIAIAGFYDTGNVWIDSYELDLSELASSVGFGVRFNFPGFPIRIDMGWDIDKDDEYTETERWSLWIGYDY